MNNTDKEYYREKRNAALIGVLTLGLAGLSLMGTGEAWRSNIFHGTSMDKGLIGFVLNLVSFIIISMMMAVPFFIISVFQLIYYQLKLL